MPRPLWAVLTRNDGGVWGQDGDFGDTVVLRSTELNLDGSWTIDQPAYRRLTATEFEKGILLDDDLVVTKSSGSPAHLGKAGIVDAGIAAMRPAYSNFMQRLRVSREASPKYVFWLLNSTFGRETLNYLGSTTTGLRNLTGGVLDNILFPGPPLGVQRAIADFLDRKTAAIDALIEKRDQSIALLAQRRQALITETLHAAGRWPVLPLKRALSCGPKNGVSPPLAAYGSGVPTFSISAVRDGKVNVLDNLKYAECDPAAVRDFLVRPGDVLVVRGNGNLKMVGNCGVVGDVPDGCIYPDILMCIRPNARARRAYLAYALETVETRKQVESAATTSNGTYKLSNADVASIRIPLPPPDEQETIARRLDTALGHLATHELFVSRQLLALREYRQSLITAAVTGQLDVTRESPA